LGGSQGWGGKRGPRGRPNDCFKVELVNVIVCVTNDLSFYCFFRKCVGGCGCERAYEGTEVDISRLACEAFEADEWRTGREALQ